MSLLPDPGELHALAYRISQHADATRARAGRLGQYVADAAWHGVAADAFHAEARIALDALHRCAGRLDHAAELLHRHADNVARIVHDAKRLGLDTLEAVEDLFTSPGDLLGDGMHLASDALHLGGDIVGSVVGLFG